MSWRNGEGLCNLKSYGGLAINAVTTSKSSVNTKGEIVEHLVGREKYGSELAEAIEVVGSIAVSIANRWQIGWPDRVQSLLDKHIYLVNLDAQVNREKNVLAKASELRHLSRAEILTMHEIKESPPTCSVEVSDGVSFIKGDALLPFPEFVHWAVPPSAEERVILEALKKKQQGWVDIEMRRQLS